MCPCGTVPEPELVVRTPTLPPKAHPPAVLAANLVPSDAGCACARARHGVHGGAGRYVPGIVPADSFRMMIPLGT